MAAHDSTDVADVETLKVKAARKDRRLLIMTILLAFIGWAVWRSIGMAWFTASFTGVIADETFVEATHTFTIYQLLEFTSDGTTRGDQLKLFADIPAFMATFLAACTLGVFGTWLRSSITTAIGVPFALYSYDRFTDLIGWIEASNLDGWTLHPQAGYLWFANASVLGIVALVLGVAQARLASVAAKEYRIATGEQSDETFIQRYSRWILRVRENPAK